MWPEDQGWETLNMHVLMNSGLTNLVISDRKSAMRPSGHKEFCHSANENDLSYSRFGASVRSSLGATESLLTVRLVFQVETVPLCLYHG